MGVAFGGYACVDPEKLHEECLREQLPVADWLGKANAFTCPLGPGQGTGWLLMPRGFIDKLDRNKQYDLVFDDGVKTATLKNLVIVADFCIIPGSRGDPSSVDLLKIADRRQLLASIPINKGYNLVDCSGNLMTASCNDGAGSGSGECCDPDGSGSGVGSGSGSDCCLWTWDDMVRDIWETVFAGTSDAYPGLPFTPDGCPYNFHFFASGAWAALNLVLHRLGCMIQYDPIKDTFGIVRVGEADAAADSAVQNQDTRRTFDYDPQKITLAEVPEKVWAVFPIYPAPKDGTSPWRIEVKDKSAAVTSDVAPGTVVRIGDTLPITADTDQAGITSRANELRDDFYRILIDGNDGLHRVYSGILGGDDQTAKLRTGSRIRVIAWEDRGHGAKTEIYRGHAVKPTFDLSAFMKPFDPGCSTATLCAAQPGAPIVRCIDFVHDFDCVQLAILPDRWRMELTQCAQDFFNRIGFYITPLACVEQGSGSGCP